MNSTMLETPTSSTTATCITTTATTRLVLQNANQELGDGNDVNTYFLSAATRGLSLNYTEDFISNHQKKNLRQEYGIEIHPQKKLRLTVPYEKQVKSDGDAADPTSDDPDRSDTSSSSTPYIPESLLGTLVGPYLSDRKTFNNFKLSSKEIYNSVHAIPAPWPKKQVFCGQVVQAVSFSPSGQLLAYSCADTIQLLDRQTGNHQTLKCPSNVTSICFSSDGQYLASGQRPSLWGNDDENNIAICIWDLQMVATFRGQIANDADDLRQGQMYQECCCQALHQYGGALTVTFSPDGKWLASGGIDETVLVWKLNSIDQSFQCIHSLQGISNWIYDVKFSPNGQYLAAVGEGETRIWLWNVQDDFAPFGFCNDHNQQQEDQELLSSSDDDCLGHHQETIHCIDFTRDGKYLVSGSDDETIRIWDLSATAIDDETASSTSSCYLKCCKVLQGNQCSVWALACAPSWKSYDYYNGFGGMNTSATNVTSVSTASSTSETLIVSGGKDEKTGERILRLWSIESGKTIRTFRGHFNYITSVAFSPSGNTIASGSFDNKLMTHRVVDKTMNF